MKSQRLYHIICQKPSLKGSHPEYHVSSNIIFIFLFISRLTGFMQSSTSFISPTTSSSSLSIDYTPPPYIMCWKYVSLSRPPQFLSPPYHLSPRLTILGGHPVPHQPVLLFRILSILWSVCLGTVSTCFIEIPPCGATSRKPSTIFRQLFSSPGLASIQRDYFTHRTSTIFSHSSSIIW